MAFAHAQSKKDSARGTRQQTHQTKGSLTHTGAADTSSSSPAAAAAAAAGEMASSARAHVMGAKAAPGAVRRGLPGGSGGNAPPRPLDRQLKKSRGGTELTAQRVGEVTVPAP